MALRDLAILGKSNIKKDAYNKVIGETKFAADLKFDHMLYGGVFRSSVPHAVIKRFDASKALALPGVARVLTSKDIPGGNRIGIIMKDEPVLVDDKVRRVGDAIALVAAETPELAEEALELMEVEYDLLEPVFTYEDAMREGSPKIHGDSNLHARKHLERGDVDAAFARCDVIIEGTYTTNMLTHMFIEPDAGVARVEDGIITVYASTQNAHFDRGEVARTMGLPNNKVRVTQMATGGGFGGKLDISVQCHLALLANATGRPVKIVRSRQESTDVSAKRHPMIMRAKTGATKDGKLLAVEVFIIGDTGAYASYGPAVITRAVVHCMGPYDVPNVRVDSDFVYTNNPMAGAFRGFGVPQVSVCHEGQMNALAKALNMDPIDLRILNAQKPGTVLATGQTLDESVGFIGALRAAKEKAAEVITTVKENQGVGVGCMWYGVGNTGLPNPAAAFVEVLPDASVNLMVGCADIGQGSSTVMALIAAEELGLSYDDIHVTAADTMVTPEGGASSASRQTFISGNATRIACRQAKETLAQTAANFLKVPKEYLIFRGRMIYSAKDPAIKMTYAELMAEMKKWGQLAVGAGAYNPKTTYLDAKTMAGIPYEVYSYGVTIALVEVDTSTGEVDTLKLVSAHDVGQAIDRVMVEGQIEGGMVMAQGFVIFEKIEHEKGKIKNPVFSKYLIPTTMDVPEIYPIIVECPGEAGPFGAKGVGEPALIPGIPAITNAVENALGRRFFELPLTPAEVMKKILS
ncbi:MAG: xanthine dehydrogenase family protein molybdopterin-binding subunit [Peptococcaceae bacterium]|jgi:CO/xanthine dehydrogenase Mo-binding subunit|nr:xanthine dehydrogenase family protein molybdopterin-binding subunit [Peptococcaceae bacterium]